MAFNKKNYPPYWRQFSEYIRFERAGNKCEKCGVPNEMIVDRGFLDANKTVPIWFDRNDGGTYAAKTGTFIDNFRIDELFLERVTKIVLTVAHLDRPGDVCQCKRFFGFKCAKPSHVLALCQSCHLAYDRDLHIAVRRKNAAKKKDLERGLFTV